MMTQQFHRDLPFYSLCPYAHIRTQKTQLDYTYIKLTLPPTLW